MPSPSKIATCCYCGTRAALVLRGRDRKELSCASCGAPLHNLKNLPSKPASTKPEKVKPTKPKMQSHPAPSGKRQPAKHESKYRTKKRRKGLMAKVLEEAWDALEDIFD